MAGHRAKQQEGTTVESVKQQGSSTKEENLTLFILTILLPPKYYVDSEVWTDLHYKEKVSKKMNALPYNRKLCTRDCWGQGSPSGLWYSIMERGRELRGS